MKRLTTRIPNSTSRTRLDEYLTLWLPEAMGKPVPKSKIRTLIMSGAVYLNRHRNKNAAADVFGGAVLEVYFDEDKIGLETATSTSITALVRNEDIVYEDEWIIVMNKKAGIPTQPTIDPGRANLFELTKKFLNQRPKAKGSAECYVGLHHRLDRDTSGLVLFTKKEEANKGVADLFKDHQIQKTYQCIVWRSPQVIASTIEDQFEVKNFLGKVSAKNENSRFGSVKSGGDHAHTYFRILDTFREFYWLEVKPKTGRTHQIRVHTSELGIPILGDPVYFPKNVRPLVSAPRLLLHAHQLEFAHPMTHKPMKIEAPLPDDFLKVLGSLRA